MAIETAIASTEGASMPDPVTDVETGKATLDEYGLVVHKNVLSREQVEALKARLVEQAELEREYEGREVPLPPHWGGYRLRPETIEFWEHRENRLHDRVRYTRAREGWKVERLAP